MAYGLNQIMINGLELKELNELNIQCHLGEHGCLYLKGCLAEGKGDETLYGLKEFSPITVLVNGEDGKKVIFSGVITNASVRGHGGFSFIEVEAKSHSILADLKKKSRSFQNTDMTYSQLIQSVMADYKGSDINLNIQDKPIGEIAIQYRETDWEFIKRMLSMLSATLVCHLAAKQLQIYGGIQPVPKGNWKYARVRSEKELGIYDYWKQQGASVNDVDFLVYTIETDHVPELFEQVDYKGKLFIIRGYTYSLEKGLLYCRCELQKKEGILEPKHYPMNLIGVALEGKILNINGNKVKIQLKIDKEDISKSVYWFPYSTLSASPDGSGWYYMPERGDKVRIYFPSKYTKDVIAISSVSDYDGESDSKPDRMGSPSTKYLSNVHGQEMSLAQDGVNLKCAGGAASVLVGSDGKVSLFAQKEIKINAKNNVDITAETDIVFHGSKTVAIVCAQGGQLQALEDGTLYIKGTEVKVD